MSYDEAIQRFGDHPDTIWKWREHTHDTIHRHYPSAIKSRDYGWFALFGVWGDDARTLWGTRGLPPDISKHVRHEHGRAGGDGHCHSWLMVSEILNHPKVDEFSKDKVDWLRENIIDPDNTRMVFWFG